MASAGHLPEFLSLLPGFFATSVEESMRSLGSLLRPCFLQLSAEDLYLMLGYKLSVLPYVRQAMFSRPFHNDDLLPRIRKPVLIMEAAHDAVVKTTALDRQKAGLPLAQIHVIANAGHATFWDDGAAFNHHLWDFPASL